MVSAVLGDTVHISLDAQEFESQDVQAGQGGGRAAAGLSEAECKTSCFCLDMFLVSNRIGLVWTGVVWLKQTCPARQCIVLFRF